jgi:hypothetical protein
MATGDQHGTGWTAVLPRHLVSIAYGLGAGPAAWGDTPAGMTDLAARP